MKNDDLHGADIRRTLGSLLFDPDGSDTEYFGEGWDNRLFLTRSGFILRIARTEANNDRLLREARTLLTIESRISLSVPHVDWIHRPTTNSPLAAMMYRPLSGASLDARDVDSAAVSVLAPVLAEFLDRLHAVPVEIADELGVPRFTPLEWLARHDELVYVTREVVRARLHPETFAQVESWWSEYRTDPMAVDFDPRFIHGDLACEHVLVERDPWRVTGVIDFGDAMLADPALDLAGFPDDLAQEVLRHTSLLQDTEPVWRRRSAYRRLGPLHAVQAGIERHDFALLDEGIAALNLRFSV